jgi:hypothetical protein
LADFPTSTMKPTSFTFAWSVKDAALRQAGAARARAQRSGKRGQAGRTEAGSAAAGLIAAVSSDPEAFETACKARFSLWTSQAMILTAGVLAHARIGRSGMAWWCPRAEEAQVPIV